MKLSVISQKSESQNGSFKKTKHAKFPEKRTFLISRYAHVRIKRTKCSFLGKFGVLCFLETPVLRLALLSYYRRSNVQRRENHFYLHNIQFNVGNRGGERIPLHDIGKELKKHLGNWEDHEANLILAVKNEFYCF